MKLSQIVVFDEISDEFGNAHVRSKTRSLGQMLGKHCVHSRDHIFRQIIMKVGQNFCLDEILKEYENESYLVKK